MIYDELLVTLRIILGLTQIEMSKILGVSQSCISKLEDGKLDPDIQVFLNAKKLAKERRVWIVSTCFEMICEGHSPAMVRESFEKLVPQCLTPEQAKDLNKYIYWIASSL